MQPSACDTETSPWGLLIGLVVASVVALGIAVYIGVSRFDERLQGSLGQLVTINERVMVLTSQVKQTGDTALSGSREAHERIDRLDARLASQDRVLAALKGKVRQAEEDVQILKTAIDADTNVRVETQEPAPTPDSHSPWPPAN